MELLTFWAIMGAWISVIYADWLALKRHRVLMATLAHGAALAFGCPECSARVNEPCRALLGGLYHHGRVQLTGKGLPLASSTVQGDSNA